MIARLRLVGALLLCLLVACDPVGQQRVETSSGESFSVGLQETMERLHGTSDADDTAALHLEALRYVMAHRSFGYAKDAAKLAAVGTLARELQAPVNEILLAHGVATIFPPEFGKDVTLIVSKKAKLLVVRRWSRNGSWQAPFFSAFDLAEVPEALDPQATLSAEAFAQRARFVEEPEL